MAELSGETEISQQTRDFHDHTGQYDFIEIRDGNSASAELLGKHCSNIAPPAIISSGPAIYIKFASDYAHQGAGFSLRYEIFKTECVGDVTPRDPPDPSLLMQGATVRDLSPLNAARLDALKLINIKGQSRENKQISVEKKICFQP
ncbi:hypothetical protein JZ751_014036 [Albula glossodonta]|uniref:CUB domain-containing protein n=1 Tax=Albula glossodonta TaxID=121402 RepID=A0A8T2N3B0_9TELE|nr:hypothetical protein JZ751_014036 [Albula glossodonta]